MSNVTLQIGGRNFTVACARGEEAHIAGLAQLIDARLSTMGEAAGQSESRMLLYAALLLADEVHETAAAPQPEPKPEFDARLGAIADRLENLAAQLETGPASA